MYDTSSGQPCAPPPATWAPARSFRYVHYDPSSEQVIFPCFGAGVSRKATRRLEGYRGIDGYRRAGNGSTSAAVSESSSVCKLGDSSRLHHVTIPFVVQLPEHTPSTGPGTSSIPNCEPRESQSSTGVENEARSVFCLSKPCLVLLPRRPPRKGRNVRPVRFTFSFGLRNDC